MYFGKRKLEYLQGRCWHEEECKQGIHLKLATSHEQVKWNELDWWLSKLFFPCFPQTFICFQGFVDNDVIMRTDKRNWIHLLHFVVQTSEWVLTAVLFVRQSSKKGILSHEFYHEHWAKIRNIFTMKKVKRRKTCCRILLLVFKWSQ